MSGDENKSADASSDDLEKTRERPPPAPPSSTMIDDASHSPSKEDANTAVDVKAMEKAEAERVLARTDFSQEEIPTAQPAAPPSPAKKPASAGALSKPAGPRPPSTMRPTGAAPVPAPRLAKPPPPPRAREPSIEELTGSALLPESGSTPAAEEETLSGSVLVEEPLSPKAKPPLPARASKSGAVPPAWTAAAAVEVPGRAPAPIPAPAPLPRPADMAIIHRADPPLVAWAKSAWRSLSPRMQGAWRRVQDLAPAGSALREGRPKWFLPVVGVAGLVVGIGLVGLVVTAVRKPGDERAARPRASAHPPTPATIAPAPTPIAPAPPAITACTVSGPPHVVAPGASLAAGVEAVSFDDSIALGFASSDHDAVGVKLDPSSLAVAAPLVRAHTGEPIRRVTPFAGAKALSLVIDADKKSDRVQSRRTVAGSSPLQLGASDGHVVWARVGGGVAGKLWSIDSGAPVDAMRGAAEGSGERTIAIALRSGSSVWTGAAGGEKAIAAKGSMSRIDGLGTSVGSPAVALSNGVALVVWADRPSTDDPWRLRWVRFKAGDAAGEPQAFSPPAGGAGGNAMSPGVAALADGRFLLVWTEGPQARHDVRALTLSSEGAPVGAPLAISNEGVNAGQGQAAIGKDGRGLVAFLESNANGFQLVATPVSCARAD